MSFFSILGIGNNRIKKLLRQGAIIIDVRPAGAFDAGKVKDSINIPVDRLNINLQRIRQMGKPIIVCSDSRSENEIVINLLKAEGIKDIHNGGNWKRLLKLVRSL